MRAGRRRPALSRAVAEVVRADQRDPLMAAIAVRTLDLDRLATELEARVDYDAWSARLVAASRVDAILVGDSVAMVVHGHANTLAATAAAHLGQARVALDWTDRVELRTASSMADPLRRSLTETAVAAINPNDFPLIAADLAYVRGMAYRQLGEEDKAQVALSKATINGALTAGAQQALADPTLQLVVIDEEIGRAHV